MWSHFQPDNQVTLLLDRYRRRFSELHAHLHTSYSRLRKRIPSSGCFWILMLAGCHAINPVRAVIIRPINPGHRARIYQLTPSLPNPPHVRLSCRFQHRSADLWAALSKPTRSVDRGGTGLFPLLSEFVYWCIVGCLITLLPFLFSE